MNKKQIGFLTIVLPDGSGDFGNLLNFARNLKEINPNSTLHAMIVCDSSQKQNLESIFKGNKDIQCEFIAAPTDPKSYKSHNQFHYGIPGPGPIVVSDQQMRVIMSCSTLIEFPVLYPHRQKSLKSFKGEWIRILEYGRSPGRGTRGIIQTGFGKKSRGILYQPTSYFERLFKKTIPTSFLRRCHLDHKKIKLKPYYFTFCYTKFSEKDPELSFLKNFIILTLIAQQEASRDILLLTPIQIEKLVQMDAILYEFNIKEVHIFHPTKGTIKQIVQWNNLSKRDQTILKGKNPPHKKLVILCGYRCAQLEFHRLLSLSIESLDTSGSTTPPHFVGVSGDGSVTDSLSLASEFDHLPIFPIIFPTIDYHITHKKSFSRIASQLNLSKDSKKCLKHFFDLSELSGLDLLYLVKQVAIPAIKKELSQFYSYLRKKYNLKHNYINTHFKS